MFCGNCGSKMNDGEKFCQSCGNPVEVNQSNGNFNAIISRPGGVMGFAVPIHVNVDGSEYDLAAGNEIKLNLSKGEHVVKYKVWNRREHEVTISVQDGKTCNVIFQYDALWGGFKVSKNSVL